MIDQFPAAIAHEAIDIHLEYGKKLPTGHSTMHLDPIDGAASRAPTDATAFAYRGGGWAGVIVGVDPDPGNDRVQASYLSNYERLSRIKHRYDPDNVFHVNQNIQPAAD